MLSTDILIYQFKFRSFFLCFVSCLSCWWIASGGKLCNDPKLFHSRVSTMIRKLLANYNKQEPPSLGKHKRIFTYIRHYRLYIHRPIIIILCSCANTYNSIIYRLIYIFQYACGILLIWILIAVVVIIMTSLSSSSRWAWSIII